MQTITNQRLVTYLNCTRSRNSYLIILFLIFLNAVYASEAEVTFESQHTIQMIENESIPGGFKKEQWYFARILFQIIIVVGGTAGVLILSCVCCARILTYFFSRREINLQQNMHSYNRIQWDQELGFDFSNSRNRNPWSPSVYDDQEGFNFNYDENNDKPPSYDELGSKVETPGSPPPPYSLSFLSKVNHDLQDQINMKSEVVKQ